MKKLAVVAVLTLISVAFATVGCSGLSCSGASSAATTEALPATVSTATTLPPTTTSSTTTTSTTTTSTTTTSITTTTLSPLEAYRASMKVWADTYGPGLAQAYAAMSGANFTNPTPAQIQAAKDLDTLMGPMVDDLKTIEAPPDLVSAHAGFVASLQKMAGGAHDLSQSLEQGQSLRALAAVATVAAAWQEGASARANLEQALGFSLSG
jgi:hypothetical protein